MTCKLPLLRKAQVKLWLGHKKGYTGNAPNPNIEELACQVYRNPAGPAVTAGSSMSISSRASILRLSRGRL